VHTDLLPNIGHLLPRRIERMGRLIELRLRRDAGREETSLAVVLLLRVAAIPLSSLTATPHEIAWKDSCRLGCENCSRKRNSKWVLAIDVSPDTFLCSLVGDGRSIGCRTRAG
jgi:hypothetical protein